MYQRLMNGSGLAITLRLGLAVAAGAATGCVNDLLEFDPGDRVESGTLEGPESAELLVSSAVGDFECAFVQYIVTTSQVTDEMDNSNLASTEAFQLDRRSVNKERTHYALFPCGTHEGLLTPIQTARFDAFTSSSVHPSSLVRILSASNRAVCIGVNSPSCVPQGKRA